MKSAKAVIGESTRGTVSQSCSHPPLSRVLRSKRSPQSWTHKYVICQRDIQEWLGLLFKFERSLPQGEKLLDIRGKYTSEAWETAVAI
jgi:hypothetical protein